MATMRTHLTIDRPADAVWAVVSDAGTPPVGSRQYRRRKPPAGSGTASSLEGPRSMRRSSPATTSCVGSSIGSSVEDYPSRSTWARSTSSIRGIEAW